MKTLILLLQSFSICAMAQSGIPCIPLLDKVPAEIRVMPKAKLSILPSGNIAIDGQIRYLMGVELPDGYYKRDVAHTTGYPASLNWLYESPMTYEIAQRLGFGSLCLQNTVSFLRRYNPRHPSGYLIPEELEAQKSTWRTGLPCLINFGWAPWGNGKMAAVKALRGKLPPEAFNDSPRDHWIPYNINHPEGREVYLTAWRDGARDAIKSGCTIVAYELFNESILFAGGPYDRKCFAAYLAKQYGNIENLNHRYGSAYSSFEQTAAFKSQNQYPGLYVDWSKFIETSWATLCRDGRSAIRKIDQNGRTSLQTIGESLYRTQPGLNLYALNQVMDVVEVSTGGGIQPHGNEAPSPVTVESPSTPKLLNEGIMERHFYRAMADGKPIVNGELYCHNGYNSKGARNAFWLDHMRGADISYLFAWSKRAYGWNPPGNAAGGKKLAEMFPYMILNPYAFPPENMEVFPILAKEFRKFGDYFDVRDRRTPGEIALLFSYPSKHWTEAVGYTTFHDFPRYGGALEFMHYPLDVIFEEQLPQGRAGRYKAIIAVGVRSIYPETAKQLREYVKKGGILILGKEFMTVDEYGKRIEHRDFLDGVICQKHKSADKSELQWHNGLIQPSILPGSIKGYALQSFTTMSKPWQTLATMEGKSVLVKRTYGQGKVYLLTPTLPDYALAAVLGSILAKNGIKPQAELRRIPEGDLAPNIELHGAKVGMKKVYFLFNHDLYPKLISFQSPELTPMGSAVDLIRQKNLPRLKDGSVQLLLEPDSMFLLGIGPENAFDTQFGPFQNQIAKEQACYLQELQKQWSNRPQECKTEFQFYPDLAKTRPLDLRYVSNQDFVDDTAQGDGKGGWTDQGPSNSLTGVPWGTLKLQGVPCELIRPDQNGGRACIVLKSKSQITELPSSVCNISVNSKSLAIYFFQASAWSQKNALAYTCVVHYASGKKISIPMICGKNIFDWYLKPQQRNVAWRNSDNKGFTCYRWANPRPRDEIRTIDLVSASGIAIPIIIGITVEEYEDLPASRNSGILSFADPHVSCGKNVSVKMDQDAVNVSITGENKPWSAVFNIYQKDPHLPMLPFKGILKFEVNGGADPFGVIHGGAKFNVALGCHLPSGKEQTSFKNAMPYLSGKVIDNNSKSWQTVSVPIAYLIKNTKYKKKGFNKVLFQFHGSPQAGLMIRNLRLELQK